MEQFYGLTLVTLFLCIVKVYGQACPEGATAAQMCVPGTYTGERVLIDTASYDPAVSNCTCTFGTTSSVLKLVTYVAPNYPECNSAVRLYSSSGNSIRFQCLMSGTYLDTAEHNVGVTTFEKYGDVYDKNYCLMLEIAGRVGDTVTVSCSADTQNIQTASDLDTVQNTTDSINNTENATVNTINNTSDGAMNTSTETNTPVIKMSTTDKSSSATTSTLQKTSSGIEVSTTGYVETENTTEVDTTNDTNDSYSGNLGIEMKKKVDPATMEISTESLLVTSSETISESNTGRSSAATSQPVTSPSDLAKQVELLTTATVQKSTTTRVLQKEFPVDRSTFTQTTHAPLKLDLTFSNMVIDNRNETMTVNEYANETYNESMNRSSIVTNDTVESTTKEVHSDINETTHVGMITAIVTGTVLFNGGGENSPKTIQTIGAVPQADLLGSGPGNVFESTTSETVPAVDVASTANNNSDITMSVTTASTLLSHDVFVSTQPVDVSNLLVMGPESSPGNTKITGIENNSSNSNSNDYSIRFPSFDTMLTPTQQHITTTSDIINQTSFIDINNSQLVNDTVYMTTGYETSFRNSSETKYTDVISNSSEASPETSGSGTFSIRMTSSDSGIASTENTLSTHEMTGNTLKTSPFMTQEVRFTMENTEPSDVVGNITIRSIDLIENTTATIKGNSSSPSAEKRSVTNLLNTSAYDLNATEIQDLTNVPASVESPDVATNTDSYDLALDNMNNLLTQSTPVNFLNYSSFPNDSSMADSNATIEVSSQLNINDSSEGAALNNELAANYTSGIEMYFTNVPTTPSALDFVDKTSTAEPTTTVYVTNLSGNIFGVQTIHPGSKVVSTSLYDTNTQTIPGEIKSFETSTNYFQGQTSENSTMNVAYGSASIAEQKFTETSTETVPEFHQITHTASFINYENNSTSHTSASNVTLPTANETSVNYFSSVGDMNLSELYLNDTAMDTTENLTGISFVHQESVVSSDFGTYASASNESYIRNYTNFSEVSTSEATPDLGLTQPRYFSNVQQENEVLPDLNASQAYPEITTQHADKFGNVLQESIDENTIEIAPGITTPQQSLNQFSSMFSNAMHSSPITTTEVPQEITMLNIDQMSFVQGNSVLPSETNVTDGLLDTATTNARETSSFNLESIAVSDTHTPTIPPPTSGQITDHFLSVMDENAPVSAFNTTQEIPENGTGSFDNLYITEHGAAFSTGAGKMRENNKMLTPFTEQSAETITVTATSRFVYDAAVDQHNLLTSAERFPSKMFHETTKVTSKDVMIQTTQSISEAMSGSGVDMYTDKVVTDDTQTTAGKVLLSTISNNGFQSNDITTNSLPTTHSDTSTESAKGIVEEIFVADKVPHVETIMHEKMPIEDVMVQNKIPLEEIVMQQVPQTEETTMAPEKTTQLYTVPVSFTDNNLPSDLVLADIAKQIITEEKSTMSSTDFLAELEKQIIAEEKTSLSPPTDVPSNIDNQIITERNLLASSLDLQSSISPKLQEQSSTLAAVVSVTDQTTDVTQTPVPVLNVATDVEPKTIKTDEMVPPEPIIPKRPAVIEEPVPTSPVQTFNVIGDTAIDTDETGPKQTDKKTETAGDKGMNVYFDTGKSKEPYEMNNDTYIIVVGAIVGLVVIAVVIGIFCHNTRKSRSEKANISGNGEPASHRNQAFDSAAADAEQGTNGIVNGVEKSSGLPEENGGANGVAEKEQNGNVEL